MSLQEVEDMTWAEFCLRKRGKERRDMHELESIRLLSYNNYLCHWQNPKKKPLKIDQYWPLTETEIKVNNVDKMAERFKAVYIEYLNDTKKN